MKASIKTYNNSYSPSDALICNGLAEVINSILHEATSKIWHVHPVWFLNENPIVGYSKQKAGIRLMFWSGADFEEENLNIVGKKFKDASIFYTDLKQVKVNELKRWLKKSRTIQWDYKNIVKRKGRLEKL